jgi:hypothetical protein
MPAAVGEEPIARPISTEPAVIAVLISAPLPTSLQLILPPAIFSNQPSPLAIMVGFVSTKKATLTLSGAFPAASSARAGKPAVSAAPPSATRAMKRRRPNAPDPCCLVMFPSSSVRERAQFSAQAASI